MSNLPLRPLKPKDRDIPGFSVCDIEAADWIKFLVIGLAYKVYDKTDYDTPTEKRYEYFTSLTEFASFIFEDQHPHDTIFAHFGGKYDFSFLIKEFFFDHDTYFIHEMLPRGSGLLCMSVSTYTIENDIKKARSKKHILKELPNGKYIIAKRTIIFRDSSAMLPASLASLTKDFGVEHKKQEIDYEKIKEVTPELLEYLEYDNWGLYEVIEKFFRWPMIRKAGPAFTIASQSLRVFRTFLKDDINSLSAEVDEFVRDSYFGGRTEIFKPFFEQTQNSGMLRSYDVNSLYPFIMRQLEYPGQFKCFTHVYKENELGFYDVEVTVPEMYVPPLGLRYEGMEHRLIFPTGTFRGVWSTLELNYAVSIGCKINKIYRGCLFHSTGHIFRNYIDYLYAIRKKSAKGSVENVICKLLMNSTYGRFGLNLDREKLVFDHGQLGVSHHSEINLNEDGTHIIRLMSEPVFLENSFTHVAIPAWVTSGARIHMHKLISENPEGMYYMDTDSLKTTSLYNANDDDLGELKLEYKMQRAAFILPKTYLESTTSPIFAAFDVHGKPIKGEKTANKIVMKGFDKKKIAKFDFDDFAACLEGDMARLRATNPKKFATLKTAIKKNQFLALLDEQPRQIRTRYNKRRVYKRAWEQVYDTEALHIKNGEIQNMDKDILKKWKPPTREDFQRVMDEVNAQWAAEAKQNG